MTPRLLSATFRMLCSVAIVSSLVGPATAATKTSGARIEFNAQAQRTAPNDMGYATAFVELSGPNLAEIAQRANIAMGEAILLAKARPTVTSRTGTSRTTPIYAKGKNGVTTIESWRVRSELSLETRDAAALGELLGQLQTAGIAVSDVNFAPSPESRRKAEDDAAIDAIKVFREKAARYAGALKKPYHIRQLDINSSGGIQPMVRGAAMMAADANMLPVEPGESNVVVTIRGQIELIE